MSSSTDIVPAAKAGAATDDKDEGLSNQYLTFSLAEEEYGVDILRVQEIKGWTPVTRIPKAPEYIRGVLNLRGEIVPIVDLRMRFGLDNIAYTATTVVIVLGVKRPNDTSTTIGIVVDGVSDVLSVAREDIRNSPDFGTVVDTHFIAGLTATKDGMVMLLDIDELLSIDELQTIDSIRGDNDRAGDDE